jgi:hypothetical protein
MCVDCVLASSRIAQVDSGDEPLPEVVLSQAYINSLGIISKRATKIWDARFAKCSHMQLRTQFVQVSKQASE